jgi:hypothetical protein
VIEAELETKKRPQTGTSSVEPCLKYTRRLRAFDE